MPPLKFKSTADIKVQKGIIDQVLGQDEAVQIMKKAAQQRRHVLLIGSPGTGKSMLGMGLAELLPKEKLVDILSFPNPNDENTPLIRTVPAGQGRDLVARSKMQTMGFFKNQNIFVFILVIISMIAPWWALNHYSKELGKTAGAIIFTAFFLGGMLFLAAFVIFLNVGRKMNTPQVKIPRSIVDNFRQKQAPFFDATGAHAGALLGDVLHDPFQSLNGSNKLTIIDDKNAQKNINTKELIENLFSKNKQKVLKKFQSKALKVYQTSLIKEQNNYEAIHLPKNELFILGETNGSVSPVEVLSCNRYDYDGKMIKLTTSENKELIVTPEHKIAINKDGEINYVEAKDIKEGTEIVAKSEDVIIYEQDIINTYDEKQQEQCKLYYQYLEIKKQNPSWGYKRIAKAMGQNIGKTRWWHAKKHIPVPIQTASWLKDKGLLPLKTNNSNLPLIAKVLGSTFGDGGVFNNLNGIFLSSSEKEAVEEFGKDIGEIFNLNKNENSRIIEGGEYGHSWCYQNTNRNIIRFFLALGAPKGNKSSIEIKVPNWVYLREEFLDQFFGSFLGSEIGIPKIHVSKNHLNTFDIAITGSKRLETNRYEFLSLLNLYFQNKGIKANIINSRKTRNEENYLYRLLISTKIDNMIMFIRNLKLNYCFYKKEKLVGTINEFIRIKRIKYEELLKRGYGAESCMSLLNLTPESLYEILNNKRFVLKKAEA